KKWFFFYQLKKNVRKAYFEKFSVISRFLVQHFSQGLDCKIKNVKISLTNTFSRWFYVDVANTFLQKCLLALFCRLCLPLNFSATKQKKSHQKSPKTRSNITRLTLLHLPPQTKTSISLAVKTTRPFSNPNPGGDLLPWRKGRRRRIQTRDLFTIWGILQLLRRYAVANP
uniref:Uncharacterized protein n=1 Tax=Cucumis melo TaxID=3656 RepID=A0A9I9CM81_CUCME